MADDPYAEIPVKDFSYTNPPSQRPSKKIDKQKWLYVAAAIIIVIILALAALFVVHHKKTTTKKTTTVSTSTNISKKTTSTFGLSFTPSTSYNSTNFNLEVNYPSNWQINETASDLTILSPATNLKDGQGQLVSGKILVSVFNQGQIPAAFGSGASVAVLTSTTVSYTNPTMDQAAQTYITFVQYPSTTIHGGLDAVYVTGNYGYTAGQNIPNSDINNVDPLVIVSFLKCSGSNCSSTSDLTIASSQWNNSGFSNLIESIVKNFTFN